MESPKASPKSSWADEMDEFDRSSEENNQSDEKDQSTEDEEEFVSVGKKGKPIKKDHSQEQESSTKKNISYADKVKGEESSKNEGDNTSFNFEKFSAEFESAKKGNEFEFIPIKNFLSMNPKARFEFIGKIKEERSKYKIGGKCENRDLYLYYNNELTRYLNAKNLLNDLKEYNQEFNNYKEKDLPTIIEFAHFDEENIDRVITKTKEIRNRFKVNGPEENKVLYNRVNRMLTLYFQTLYLFKENQSSKN